MSEAEINVREKCDEEVALSGLDIRAGDIMALAYTVAEAIGPLAHNHSKLSFDHGNGLMASYALVHRLLVKVPEDYLASHERVKAFYFREHVYLARNNDRLWWYPKPEAYIGPEPFVPDDYCESDAKVHAGLDDGDIPF